MFSDIYKIWEIASRHAWGWRGKLVSGTDNTDDSFTGGSASAERPEVESTQHTAATGVDIVTKHHLQETSSTKEAYKNYIKDVINQRQT
ncbi:unnamed protein product [Gulo gulo]|uniref:Translationally-controlled tumor protein n=1 Tax=Gulo gulo TaxID=48420 RepID=A0A9X9ME14_GULGU|nr:unnamed protein product [Gulo gulo]